MPSSALSLALGRSRAEQSWAPPPSSMAAVVLLPLHSLCPNRARHHLLQPVLHLPRRFPGLNRHRSSSPPWPSTELRTTAIVPLPLSLLHPNRPCLHVSWAIPRASCLFPSHLHHRALLLPAPARPLPSAHAARPSWATTEQATTASRCARTPRFLLATSSMPTCPSLAKSGLPIDLPCSPYRGRRGRTSGHNLGEGMGLSVETVT
jgi:hypothetical protein